MLLLPFVVTMLFPFLSRYCSTCCNNITVLTITELSILQNEVGYIVGTDIFSYLLLDSYTIVQLLIRTRPLTRSSTGGLLDHVGLGL